MQLWLAKLSLSINLIFNLTMEPQKRMKRKKAIELIKLSITHLISINYKLYVNYIIKLYVNYIYKLYVKSKFFFCLEIWPMNFMFSCLIFWFSQFKHYGWVKSINLLISAVKSYWLLVQVNGGKHDEERLKSRHTL